MKSHSPLVRGLPFLALLILPASLLAPPSFAAIPVTTEFSYQGQLVQNGVPFNGSANFRFSLWDAIGVGTPPSGGSQIGSAEVVADVTVTNGLFVVLLNGMNQFGANAFNGDARWLQIEVCSDPTCTAAPTVLAPRQVIDAVPYASFSAGPWRLSGTALSYSLGNVGIGTTTPATPLHVVGNATLGSGVANNTALTIPGPNSPTDANSAQDIRVAFGSAGSTRVRSYRGASWDTYLQFLTNPSSRGFDDPLPRMTIDGDGNVGIGTTTPVVKLDVLGDIYLGAGPRYSVPGAEENLKMLRGRIESNGTVTAGCCFSVTRVSAGVYDITYTTAFSQIPSVFIQPVSGDGVGASIAGPGPLSSPTTTGCRVLIAQSGTINFTDDPFYFFAIGPR